MKTEDLKALVEKCQTTANIYAENAKELEGLL